MKKKLVLLIALFAMLFAGCMTTENTKGQATLIEAVRAGDTEIVKELIADGVDISIKDEYGLTPLANAAARGYTAIVEALLEAGADVNAADTFGTVLIHAAAGGSSATIEALIEAGADVNATGHVGITALMSLATGRTATAKTLLRAGADVSATDRYGFTPLLNAASRGYLDTVELLIENGAEIEKIDTSNKALMQASTKNEARILLFLKGGAVLEARDIYNTYKSVQGYSLLDNMTSLQEVFDDVMTAYSRIWRTIIEISVDDVTDNAVFLTTEACYENGANDLLDEYFQTMSDKVKILDNTAYSSTLECYAILEEYKRLVKTMLGSFNDFNALKTRLDSDFQRTMALAEME